MSSDLKLAITTTLLFLVLYCLSLIIQLLKSNNKQETIIECLTNPGIKNGFLLFMSYMMVLIFGIFWLGFGIYHLLF